jgi:phosphoribosyl 1,2-cyclic phosphodiesterase
MSLSITSLNSGSNGNCYYISNEDEAVLIDGGISCRETERRMKRLGLSMKRVKALFVSHEHADHIYGVASISKKHKLPVYITSNTLANGHLNLQEDLTYSFDAYKPVAIGNLSVTAFPKYHDASDPHSFIVSGSGVNIGVFTDIGIACNHVKKNFEICHAAFLEANYDEMMLEHGNYPYHLKNRIRGDNGHLSNMQALRLFQNHRPPFMSHLFLSHLSKNNNSPEIVARLFTKNAGRTEIIIATRHEETAVYTIDGNPGLERPIVQTNKIKRVEQLSLF